MNHLYLATSALLCAVQVVNGVIYNGEKLGFCRSDDSDESCSISIRGTGEGSLRQFEMVEGNAALFGAGAGDSNKIQSNTMVFFSATEDALALNPDPSQSGLVKTGKYDPSTFEFSGRVVTSNVLGCSAITSAGEVATATTLGGSSSPDVFTQMYIVEKGTADDNYTADGDKQFFGGKWVALKQTWEKGSSTPTECTATAQCANEALPFASFKIQGYGALLGTVNGKFLMPDGTNKTVDLATGTIADMFTSMYFKGGSAFSVRGDIEAVPGDPKCFKTKQDGTCEDRISIAPNEVKMLVAVPKWTWTEITNNASYACATTEYDISLDGTRMPSTDVKLEFFTGDEYVESVGPLTVVSVIRWVKKDTDTVISIVELQVHHMIDTTEATLHNFVRYERQNPEGTQAPADVRFTLHTCASRSDYSGGEPGNVYIDPSVYVLDIVPHSSTTRPSGDDDGDDGDGDDDGDTTTRPGGDDGGDDGDTTPESDTATTPGGPNDSNRVTASALTSVVLLAFLSF